MNQEVARECTLLSEEEKISFPEVVGKLIEADIDSYIANLITASKVYYKDNQTFEIPLNIKYAAKPALEFNTAKIYEAVRAIQAKKIAYQEFIKQIMEAGVVIYGVYIKGRKAIYFGRNGEQHVELFPN